MSNSDSGSSNTVMNPDLERERQRATFAAEQLTHVLDGGSPAKTARRRQLEALIARDPTGIFSNDDNAHLHRTDRHVRALAKFVRLVELARQVGIGSKQKGLMMADPDFYTLVAAAADDFPTALHWVMFVPNILSLCNAQQQAAWLPLCRDWRMIGCYAQTELGHGSNVRALETTATFVPESQGGDADGSFVIHSPTLTSAKFWPGTLGRTANHAMVIARLIDGEGIDRGVHNFLVPLRSMKDHTLLKGVTTGDIGPKIGYNVMDNGYARFDHVKIPRGNMAMRFAAVDKHGRYTKKHVSDAVSKIAYITMMQVRAYIVNEAGKNLAMACTISIRYSAVRRQGFVDPSASTSSNSSTDEKNAASLPEELQILDYKQQQHRLFSMLACSYCFFFTGQKLLQRLQTIERSLVNNPTTSKITKTVVADLHASSSSLKSATTTVCADGMEDCRKACGGHGFLQSSALPELVTSYLQNPTVEGDNYMLPQQVVKVLLKLVQAVQEHADDDQEENENDWRQEYDLCDSRDLIPWLQVILKEPQQDGSSDKKNSTTTTTSSPPTVTAAPDLLDLDLLQDAFGHRAAYILVQVAAQLQQDSLSGKKSPQQVWNNGLVEMARASRSYAQFLLLRNFCQGIVEQTGGNSSLLGPPEVAVLQDLARLFALYWMEREMGDFLQTGFLSTKDQQQPHWVRCAVLQLLDRIRPNAVALVDAWDFSDFKLRHSTLGRFDGNVYPAILQAARRDPLNQTDPGPGYQEHLKRLIVDGVGAYTPSRL